MNDPTKYSTLRSALAVPLNGINGCLGVLALYRTERDGFSKENLRILLAISSKVALAIENALTHRLLETSITTDYLTNLPNARSLWLSLDTELARAQRSRTNLAVIVCDLDGFKQINDRFGHLAGNRALCRLADIFRFSCRSIDTAVRYGGDEFAIVLPETGAKDAGQVGHRICEHLANDHEEPLLSVSVGMAVDPEDGTTIETLMQAADRALYKMKHQEKTIAAHSR